MSRRSEGAGAARRPDPADLDAAAIAASATGARIGRRVVVMAEVPSTMDVLAALAAAGEREGTVLIADFQSAGRGRLDRQWVAPPGSSLLLSILLRPTVAATRRGEVMMALALGTLDALDAIVPPPAVAALKWPNDVVVDGRKIAGLLAEARPGAPGGHTGDAIIVGLGLNVRQTGDALWPGATSLAAMGIAADDRTTIAIALLRGVGRHYDRLERGESLLAAWSGRLETLGRDVVASTGARAIRGRAVGVAADGALEIATADGTVVTVRAGDVTLASQDPPATPG